LRKLKERERRERERERGDAAARNRQSPRLAPGLWLTDSDNRVLINFVSIAAALTWSKRGAR
jgi:hypothetical protein